MRRDEEKRGEEQKWFAGEEIHPIRKGRTHVKRGLTL